MKRTRNNQFAIRLSDSELALWNRKQAASGLNKTDFLIHLLKSSVIKVYYFNDTVKQLFHELRKIGVNLNQIAYLVNIGHDHEARSTLKQISEAYFDVMERLRRFLDDPLINAYIVDTDVPPDKDGV